jgi:hypothetical protein
MTFFSAGTNASNFTALAWNNNNLFFQNYTSGSQVTATSSAVFRDPSAWYHVVLAIDTTQATAADRAKIYVNGVQQAGFSGSSFSLNQQFWINFTYRHTLSARSLSSIDSYTDQYMAEVYLIDGQALTPSSFGSTNDQTGVWQPIAYTGTYGTNGFYLPFSNTASTSTLGYDFSGNSNNWTTNNISLTTGTSIQTFSTVGTTSWTAPTGVTSVSYLVVAGGGGGGGYGGDNVGGGGGGAGGMRTGTLTVNPGTTYTVTVGAGGGPGTIGSDSIFSSITSTGGGRGGQPAGGNGGSGGGAGAATGSGSAIGLGTAGQGNNGALGFGDWGTTTTTGGGGGGAGGAGGAASGTTPGTGGAGSASSITGVSVTYAAGGAGAYGASSGGGTSGTANTGNGGEARGGQGGGSAGSGGSGIVILSWANGSTSTYDSMVDVPTQWIPYNTAGDTGALWRGNYCTLNPAVPKSYCTQTEGNLKSSGTSSTDNDTSVATMGVSSGKWYWENTINSISSSVYPILGAGRILIGNFAGQYPGIGLVGGFGLVVGNGNILKEGSIVTTVSALTANDVVGFALNLDALTCAIYRNNSLIYTVTSLTAGTYYPMANEYTSSSTFHNYGQRPFAYAPPSGFLTLNTRNLPTPTIGTTSTTQANDNFNAIIYTGNGSTQTVTGLDFTPGMLWIKDRSAVTNHQVNDQVRGVGRELQPDATTAETNNNIVTAFNSNGFSLSSNGNVNANGDAYVAWTWKAAGAGSSNTDGTITSTVSANTSAGFSIVTYTGTGSNATVGHGLGVAPSMVIVKQRSSPTASWRVYHQAIGNTGAVYLNTTVATETNSIFWNNTSPTSTTFSLGTDGGVNGSTNTYVAYCFAQVSGYSAFGSYFGNGSTDGTFVFTGFNPKFLIIKNSTATGEWHTWDSARSPNNVNSKTLRPNNSNAETDSSDYSIDFLSNGFKVRNASNLDNQSGQTFIYMAFAESPFKYALAR